MTSNVNTINNLPQAFFFFGKRINFFKMEKLAAVSKKKNCFSLYFIFDLASHAHDMHILRWISYRRPDKKEDPKGKLIEALKENNNFGP